MSRGRLTAILAFALGSATVGCKSTEPSRTEQQPGDQLVAAALIRPLDGQRLVAVPGAAPIRSGPVVYISATELVFNEQPLASLDAGRLPEGVIQGHVIVPLFDTLDEHVGKQLAVLGEDQRERVLVLALGGQVSFASAVDAMYTAGRLGFEHFDFVVEPASTVRRAIRVDPFPFAAVGDVPEELPGQPPARPKGPPQFRVLILDDGYRVSWGTDEPVLLPKREPNQRDPAAWDGAELAKLVRERTAADPGLVQGVVTAEHHITMDVVLTTYALLLGPDCRQHEDGAGCMLPELILEPSA